MNDTLAMLGSSLCNVRSDPHRIIHRELMLAVQPLPRALSLHVGCRTCLPASEHSDDPAHVTRAVEGCGVSRVEVLHPFDVVAQNVA